MSVNFTCEQPTARPTTVLRHSHCPFARSAYTSFGAVPAGAVYIVPGLSTRALLAPALMLHPFRTR